MTAATPHATDSPAFLRHPIAALPDRAALRGPLARSALHRTFLLWLVLEAAGLALVAASPAPSWQALGLGLVFPGAGFLLDGNVGLFALSLLLLTVLAWTVVIGNLLMTVVAWLAITISAALTIDGSAYWPPALVIAPALALAAALLIGIAMRHNSRFVAREAEKVQQHLATTTRRHVRSAPLALGNELTLDDLNHLRYALNRALQPVDKLDGFEIIDQFQTAGLRYQFHAAQQAIAFYQYGHAPAFDGYAKEAQELLLQKMQLRRTWAYWRWENLWGNLRLDADPIAFENVMYSGYFGTMIAGYTASTGDLRYNRPGAIRLVENEHKTYDYDLGSLSRVLYRQHMDSLEHLIPCEPGWNYPLCNAFSLNTLKVNDRINGTQYWEHVRPLVENTLQREFMVADGRFLNARHRLTGFTFPIPTLIAGDGSTAMTLHATLPEMAERNWEVTRLRSLKAAEDGSLRFDDHREHIDIGNYRFSRLVTCAGALMSAREMGDNEAIEAIEHAVRARMPVRFEHGENRFSEGSQMIRLCYVMQRMMRPAVLHDMVNDGNVSRWRDGPVLKNAAYPDVLVARAIATGGALALVLYPGSQNASSLLVIDNLLPDVHYSAQVNGQPVRLERSNSRMATLQVSLAGRTTVNVVPVAAT